jgi:hypothetical protein
MNAQLQDDDPRAALAQIKREHDELVASLPAHSIPAAMLLRIEELEEQIDALQAALQHITQSAPPDAS